MTTASSTPAPDRGGPFQLVMVGLSLYVLGALIAEKVMNLAPDTIALLQLLDAVICWIFLADFVVRFTRAESKARFMRWGWIDLLSSIPMVDALRWGRLVRVFRVLRVVRSARVLTTFMMRNRAESVLATVTLIALALIIVGSLAMLEIERDPGSNIRTPGDAVWWSFSTITTVGYGDRYPVTPLGRVIAVLMMIWGTTLFCTFTAYVASSFLGGNDKAEIQALAAEVRALRERLDRDRPTV